MQGKRTRALDSRGRPVPGLYVRDGRFIAGFKRDSRWQMRTLDAETLTEARREREGLLSGLRDGRIVSPSANTFFDMFCEYQQIRDLSERTRKHERHLVDRHLAGLKPKKLQAVTASDLGRILREMRKTYAPWTCIAVYRLMAGTFALALRRGTITRSPIDGLAPSERPKQRNKQQIAVLDAVTMDTLVMAGTSERWRAALALAGYAGLRLGEVRAVTWADVDFDAQTVTVRRSLLPDGTAKAPKTEAGERTLPMLPALRRLLIAWKLKSPHTRGDHFVICTADAKHVAERNLRRILEEAKQITGLDNRDGRLSWHSLRHSYASMLATDLELPATTLARLTGHTDAGFTLRVYAKDGRTDETFVHDVLTRAGEAGVGR